MLQISQQMPVMAIQGLAREVRVLHETGAGADGCRLPAAGGLKRACPAEAGAAVNRPPCHARAGG